MPPKISEMEKYAQTSLKKWMKKVLTEPKLKKRVKGFVGNEWHVDISVASAPKMSQINFSFRKKKYATDVLSFPADDFFQSQGLLGDIVVCAPVIVRQAKEVGHTWKRELDVLLVHGLLHLLRYDHEAGPKEEKEMNAWEKKILGPTYSKSLIQRNSFDH
jgi:probable rRNA maturation factor